MGSKVKGNAVEILGSSAPLLQAPPKMVSKDTVAGRNEKEVVHKEEHQINQKVTNHHKIITSLLAGAVAGAIAKTTIAPLDRTKINFQISNTPYSARNCLRFLLDSLRQEGVVSLWRGNTATMARIVPYAAVQYAAHEQYKRLLNRNRRKQYLTPGRRFLAGSLAGVTSVAATYPLDMVRARMAVTKKCRYHNLPQVFISVYREEGARSLYRGFSPTVLGAIPYSGTSFFTYETLKKFHAEYAHGRDPTAIERLCFGAVAGLLGQTMSYPLDIVRRRMQTAVITGHESDYRSIVSTARAVIHDEGFRRGMYKGLSLNWIKGPIAVGVSFSTFDTVQYYLRLLLVRRDWDDNG